MKTINVAIIGQGRSGRDIHGAYFKSASNVHYNVAAIVDLYPERRARALTEYGNDDLLVFEDYRDLFAHKDKIDLVVNSTFSHFHYPVTLDLLNHGFNVIVEKPMAATKAQCEEMLAAAQKNNVTLAVFQQSRFAPYFKKIKQIISSGVLGEISEISIRYSGFQRRYDWQTYLGYNGGNSYNTGPHPIDQALDLFGFDDEPNVFAYTKNINSAGDAEDFAKIILTGKNKPLIDIELNPADNYGTYFYKIHAANGSVILPDMGTIKWKYYDPASQPRKELELKSLVNDKGLPAYCSETLNWTEHEEKVNGDGAFDEAVRDYYTMIYTNLTDGTPLEIKPEQSMKQIAILEKIRETYLNNQ
jgi:Predicted dehydrogenases and related proteins